MKGAAIRHAAATCAIACCMLVAAVCSAASPTAPITAAQRTAIVNALMARYAGDVPGAALLVVQDGKPVIARGYGYANLADKTRVTAHTNFRLASVTKQFTAAAVLLLRQDGKLKLSDPIRKYFPKLPPSDAAITIRNLLDMTSGLVDYGTLIPPGRTRQLSDMSVLHLLEKEDKLYFQPGHAQRYSNGGYVLLGLIVQRVSGMDLADFMRKRIFQPLGMDHTLLYEHHRGPQVLDRAYGYSFIDGQWRETDQDITSATRGDGGVYSNIDDMAKWAAALNTGKLLDAASRRLMFTNTWTTDIPDVSYGFGWAKSGDTVWHSGESIGFRNVIVRWPTHHLAVVILSNRNHFKPYPLAVTIGHLFLLH